MQNLKFKYCSEMICFQEIPKEISLSFSISNCPNNCEGCHSPYLSKDMGEPLLPILKDRIEYYYGLITCVLFMGGDDDLQIKELIYAVKICHQYNLKVALYSGRDSLPPNDLLDILDYIKIGHYDKNLGGLKSRQTNQRLYRNKSNKLDDVTCLFWEDVIKS